MNIIIIIKYLLSPSLPDLTAAFCDRTYRNVYDCVPSKLLYSDARQFLTKTVVKSIVFIYSLHLTTVLFCYSLGRLQRSFTAACLDGILFG